MAITESFRKAVTTSDILDLRIMLKNSLIVDPSFAEFDDMNRMACNVKGLFDTHDGTKLNLDQATWTDSYLDTLMVQVINNFSHERIDHLKKVVAYLYPMSKRTPPLHSKGNSSTKKPDLHYQEQKRQDQQNGSFLSSRSKKIALGTLTGGLVGSGVGVAIGGTGAIVIGTVAGAAVVATAVAYLTNGE